MAQGSSLVLIESSGPVIYPVGGPDAGQWSVELFCLPGGLYHRDYSSVHLQVRVLAPPAQLYPDHSFVRLFYSSVFLIP